jgi:nicotinate-nucleotide adenylyltransferase
MAQAAAGECGLERVLIVPAANPPHRKNGTYAGYEDRYRMVEIACAGESLFQASRIEEGPERSYSIHTVERVRAEWGVDTTLYFIIGADAFAEIRSWHRWKDLAKAVTFAVVGRPGADYEVPENACVRRVDGVNLPISSSEIREKLAAGDQTVDLPEGVLAYIRAHRLYVAE